MFECRKDYQHIKWKTPESTKESKHQQIEGKYRYQKYKEERRFFLCATFSMKTKTMEEESRRKSKVVFLSFCLKSFRLQPHQEYRKTFFTWTFLDFWFFKRKKRLTLIRWERSFSYSLNFEWILASWISKQIDRFIDNKAESCSLDF